MINFFHSLF